MSARQPGQQLDILPLILSVEEQANENSLRVDNVMRNLVDLAGAVRTLVQKVEEQRALLEEKLSDSPNLYEMVPPVFSEDLPSTQFAILQAADTQISHRLAQLERRLLDLPAQETSGAAADLRPLEGRLNKLESAFASVLSSLEKRTTDGPAKADMSPLLRQLDSVREELDSQAGGLAARLTALERSLKELSAQATPVSLDLGPLEERLQRAESDLARISEAAVQPATLNSAISEVRAELVSIRASEPKVVRPEELDAAMSEIRDELVRLRVDLDEAGTNAGSVSEVEQTTARLREDLEELRAAQAGSSAVQTKIIDDQLSQLEARIQESFQQQIAALENEQSAAPEGVAPSELEALALRLNERVSSIQSALDDSVRQHSELITTQRTTLEQQLREVENRLETSISNRLQSNAGASKDSLNQIDTAISQLQAEHSQIKAQLPVFAEQKQLTKLMEHLTDLQTRTARQADQIKDFEQTLQRGQEHQVQLQNQLDMQERQRVLLEQVQGDIGSLKEQLAQMQPVVEQQQAEVRRLAEHAEQAARGHEMRRRASDQQVQDSSMQPLIESALHIERGEYAEAVRCLEAAQQLSDNPKLEQALQLARKMMEQHPAGLPAKTSS